MAAGPVIVTAVLTVAGAVVLVSFTRRDETARFVVPAPGNAAPGGSSSAPGKEPSGTAGGGPVPSNTSATPTGGPTAVPGVPAALRGKDIEVIPTSQPVVALTFDAGANADAVPSILATLSANGIRGTFLLTGSFAAEFPGATRAITAAGHRTGNHTATHPHSLTHVRDRPGAGRRTARSDRPHSTRCCPDAREPSPPQTEPLRGTRNRLPVTVPVAPRNAR